MADPVSWLMIEKGWKVHSSDGSEIGKVHEIVGDEREDIFDGLAVSSGLLGKPRYIPAERVKGITEGQIQVDIPSAEAQHLEEYTEPPPSEEILPESVSRWERFRNWFRL